MDIEKNYMSRMPKLYEKPVRARLEEVSFRTNVPLEELEAFAPSCGLSAERANFMVENAIGVFGLPLGIAANFIVDGEAVIVPMVTEEPSVIAACSNMARLVGSCGGFTTTADPSYMMGQIQLVDVVNVESTLRCLETHKLELIHYANEFCVGLVQRGGGCVEINPRTLQPSTDPLDSNEVMLIVELTIDCKDAMGANVLNNVLENLAPMIEKITGARSIAKILSNLSDRRMAQSRCEIPIAQLGARVAYNIVDLYRFALRDSYRACTHNKGIMNGIDAVCIATGNDFRALEAAAHAYAARGGRYTSLSRFYLDEQKQTLVGELSMPLAVGVIGGSTVAHDTARASIKVLGKFGESASALARVMVAVGLAQNLGALRALASEGIQKGHMALHRKKSESISMQKDVVFSYAPSKIILGGEHAVVYGCPAIALTLDRGVSVTTGRHEFDFTGPILRADGLGFEGHAKPDPQGKGPLLLRKALAQLVDILGTRVQNLEFLVDSSIPAGGGLGSSAALSVAILRGVLQYFNESVSQDDFAAMAMRLESIFHGNPSGIDHTAVTNGGLIWFEKTETKLKVERLVHERPLQFAIGMSGPHTGTLSAVSALKDRMSVHEEVYRHLFEGIKKVVLQMREALAARDNEELGKLMNLNQSYLNALGVSTPELEAICTIARERGALGAKLTGAGGGGAVIALVDGDATSILRAFNAAGYLSFAAVG